MELGSSQFLCAGHSLVDIGRNGQTVLLVLQEAGLYLFYCDCLLACSLGCDPSSDLHTVFFLCS